ncbi:MAG: DUF4105 domain-containing protein [Gelidibacter sp.]
MKLKLSFLFFFLLIFSGHAQNNQLSPNADISVLTIGPGESLNDAFGHSAFRINDRTVGMDVVYGYGEYDFDTPNFYLKFAQGKLNYQMSENSFSDFYRFYSYFNRTIDEQVLNLSPKEKQNLYDYLITNYKPENRKYLYDFFYDNCATRIRDVVEKDIESNVEFEKPQNFKPKTFRELIHEQTGRNNWGSFGIDLALGSVIDKKASPYEHMFLPKYIHEFFGNAKFDSDKNLVKKSTTIYKRLDKPVHKNFMFSPLMVLGLLSLLIVYITYSDNKKNKRSKWLDIILFTTTGLIGILMLLLWFATDHTATAQNYNLLWAFPLNILVIGQLFKSKVKAWCIKFLKLLLILLMLLVVHWIMGIQVYAIGLIPLLIALSIRYVFLISFFKKKI